VLASKATSVLGLALYFLLPCVGLSQADSLVELLPLSVGSAWTYHYTTYVEDQLLDTRDYDTGYAAYTVTAVIVAEDSTRWQIIATRNLQHRHYHYFPPQFDTTYALRDSTSFELVELHVGQHPVYRPKTSTDNFYSTWKSVFPALGPGDSLRYFRFGYVDSTRHDTVHVTDVEGRPTATYTFVLRENVGITSVYSDLGITGVRQNSDHTLEDYLITDANEPEIQQGPKGYWLSHNYPNPFNPSTKIEYALPHAAFVTLKIYNVLGEDVATLVSGQHDAGSFTATWDATGLPSGVYLYRLTAGGYVQSRKTVLVR
jgi:hypothetical protein